MPTQTLPMGAPFTMLAGVGYALPPVRVTLFSDVAPSLTQSDVSDFSGTPVAVTLTGGMASLAGGFLKAAANALIVIKRD